MLSFTWVLGLLVVVFAYLWKKSKKESSNLPPGPKGLPFFGNVHQIGKYPYKRFEQWVDEYGEIYHVKLGTLRMVVVSEVKLLKELFSMQDITGKMDVNFLNDVYDDPSKAHGLINTEGEHWELLRRFTLRQLRDFGFGKSKMEDYIMDEVRDTLEWLKSTNEKPVEGINEKLMVSVVSALWTIISSKRLPHDDPFLLLIASGVSDAMENVSKKGNVIFFAPWLRFIVPESTGYNGFRRVMHQIREFVTGSITEHKKTFSSSYSRDFMDVFLKEMEITEDENSPFYKELGEKMLVGTIADLFQAGSGTTSTTLAWMILYLMKFPEVQIKLQKEIEEVTGNSRFCSVSDRPNMPYAESVIAEVLRYSSLVPGGAPHRVLTSNKVVKGYDIPKDSLIVPNMRYIHFDPKLWGDPINFRPERFLDSGNKFKKPEYLIPFSIGRRQCLGETLARDSLFLFMTNIYQKFSIVPVCPVDELDIEPGMGVVLYPQKFKCIFKNRE